MHPVGKSMRWIKKWMTSFVIARRALSPYKLWGRSHNVCAGCRCEKMNDTFCLFVTGRMPRSGKLPVLFLLTGQKSGFSPRRGDSLHRFRSNLAGPTGTSVRLAVQNCTWIGADGWECGPRIIKNFHFLVKSRPAGATPSTDFQNFRGFYTPNYPTLMHQISCDSHHRLRSYCGETARR